MEYNTAQNTAHGAGTDTATEENHKTMNVLNLEDVTKDFGGAPVLSGITLGIKAGETVAIMGPSGSGKSTLLHCMSGVLTPTSGQVRFKNTVLSDASDAARSRTRLAEFGFVFQDHQLLPELSALDNVALPAMLNGTSRAKARAKAQELLNQLGLGTMIDRPPWPGLGRTSSTHRDRTRAG